MDNQELSRLVGLARDGSVEAFAMIYSEVSRSIYYYALKMTKNEHDAKDVVQETMIEVYKHLGELKNPEAFRAYVNRTACRRSLSFLRREKRRQSDDIDDMQDLAEEDDDFLPEAYAETQERRDYIIRLVDELPEAQRSVILLYYYKQLPSREIADILEIEDGAVRARLNRARKTLKQRLEKDGEKFGEKSGALLLAIPILTGIFDSEAAVVFVTEIGSSIWQSFGARLGFSAAALSAAAASATAGTTAGSAAAAGAATGTATAATAATATATTAAAASGPVIAAGVATAVVAGSVIAVNQSNPPQTAPPAVPAYVEVSREAEPQLPVSSSEPLAEPLASITAERDVLRYQAGSSPTPEQIAADAGVTALTAGGEPATPAILHYENIDFSTPNDYYVTFEVMGEDNIPVWKVVIISVE